MFCLIMTHQESKHVGDIMFEIINLDINLHVHIVHLVGYYKIIYLIIWNFNHYDFADDFIILQVRHFPKPNQNMGC